MVAAALHLYTIIAKATVFTRKNDKYYTIFYTINNITKIEGENDADLKVLFVQIEDHIVSLTAVLLTHSLKVRAYHWSAAKTHSNICSLQSQCMKVMLIYMYIGKIYWMIQTQ